MRRANPGKSAGQSDACQYCRWFLIWVWVNTYRYMFSGMNIHLPAILMFTRGTWFWHTAICWNDKDSSFMFYSWIPTFWYNHSSCGFALQRALLLKEIPWPKYRKPFQSPRNIYMLYMWLEGVWLFHVLPFFPVLISDYTMWQFNQCLQFQVQFQPLQLPHRSRWSHPRVGAIFHGQTDPSIQKICFT